MSKYPLQIVQGNMSTAATIVRGTTRIAIHKNEIAELVERLQAVADWTELNKHLDSTPDSDMREAIERLGQLHKRAFG